MPLPGARARAGPGGAAQRGQVKVRTKKQLKLAGAPWAARTVRPPSLHGGTRNRRGGRRDTAADKPLPRRRSWLAARACRSGWRSLARPGRRRYLIWKNGSHTVGRSSSTIEHRTSSYQCLLGPPKRKEAGPVRHCRPEVGPARIPRKESQPRRPERVRGPLRPAHQPLPGHGSRPGPAHPALRPCPAPVAAQ